MEGGPRQLSSIFKTVLSMKVLYHESVNELDELRRDIVKLKVVPAAVKHWENVFKVIGQLIDRI